MSKRRVSYFNKWNDTLTNEVESCIYINHVYRISISAAEW